MLHVKHASFPFPPGAAKVQPVRCRYCRDRAGFRRVCADCRRFLALYTRHQGRLSLLQLLDLYIDTGVSREKIEAFLNADPTGQGSVKDRITANMSTELLGAMGVNAPQTAHDVKRLRNQGNWRSMDARPEEGKH